jgi:hypothetical protein
MSDPYALIAAGASWGSVAFDAASVAVELVGVLVVIRGLRMLLVFLRR